MNNSKDNMLFSRAGLDFVGSELGEGEIVNNAVCAGHLRCNLRKLNGKTLEQILEKRIDGVKERLRMMANGTCYGCTQNTYV